MKLESNVAVKGLRCGIREVHHEVCQPRLPKQIREKRFPVEDVYTPICCTVRAEGRYQVRRYE
jgi:hypothetical protein